MKNKYLIVLVLLLMGILMVAISSCTREENCQVCTQVVYLKTVKDTGTTEAVITSQSIVTCSDEEREAYSAGDGVQNTIYYDWGYSQLIQETTCE